jgi:hypothetical protein
MEMRIVVGLFEWIDRVQSYYDPESGWDYNSELYKFVDGGFDEIDPFIETVNDIFVKGGVVWCGLMWGGVVLRGEWQRPWRWWCMAWFVVVVATECV